MLAQAANKAGYSPLVIDLFADEDTQEEALECVQVQDLSLLSVQTVIQNLLQQYNIQSVVYGSGMEGHLDTLSWVESVCVLSGNSAETLADMLNPRVFFPVLTQLKIPHPEVHFSLLEPSSCYLIKSPQQSGGLGIQRSDRGLLKDEYYQQYIGGESGAVLFYVSSDKAIQVIGFHRQWTVSPNDFSFLGIIKDSFLPKEAQKTVLSWLDKLVKHSAIKGLGSLDFIWDGERCYFLELNLRPSASMMLYPELDLLSAQITGIAPVILASEKVRGLQVLYAEFDCQIQLDFQWLNGCFDRPSRATRIKAGEPICSIMSAGSTIQETESQLQQYASIIKNNVIK